MKVDVDMESRLQELEEAVKSHQSGVTAVGKRLQILEALVGTLVEEGQDEEFSDLSRRVESLEARMADSDFIRHLKTQHATSQFEQRLQNLESRATSHAGAIGSIMSQAEAKMNAEKARGNLTSDVEIKVAAEKKSKGILHDADVQIFASALKGSEPFNFSTALNYLKAGFRVRRKTWSEACLVVVTGDGDPHIMLEYAVEKRMGWASAGASYDLLGTDWVVVS